MELTFCKLCRVRPVTPVNNAIYCVECLTNWALMNGFAGETVTHEFMAWYCASGQRPRSVLLKHVASRYGRTEDEVVRCCRSLKIPLRKSKGRDVYEWVPIESQWALDKVLCRHTGMVLPGCERCRIVGCEDYAASDSPMCPYHRDFLQDYCAAQKMPLQPHAVKALAERSWLTCKQLAALMARSEREVQQCIDAGNIAINPTRRKDPISQEEAWRVISVLLSTVERICSGEIATINLRGGRTRSARLITDRGPSEPKPPARPTSIIGIRS